MLDIKLLRQDPKGITAKIQTKEPNLTLDRVLELDNQVRDLKTQLEQLQNQRNERSKVIGHLKKEGKPTEDLMAEVRLLGDKITSLQQTLEKLDVEFVHELACLPNLPMDDVYISQDKADNVIIKEVGQKRIFNFPPKHHVELNEHLHLLEFQKTAKTSGAGWPAYRGWGARLEWALLNYMIDIQILRGFEFWLPPAAVRPPMMFGSGQLPKFQGQFYALEDPSAPLYLVPTAEIVLNGLHYDEILDEHCLPIKYAAYTPCFRREAGAAGAGERGLIRVHQFNKVEMFAFTKPEDSPAMFEEMLSVAEEILQGLGLHYRLSKLATGDMSFTAAKTVDVEVWLPGQNRYYEVSSVSNCTDYQARRSQIRYRAKGTEKTTFVHTLNGSGLATSRLFVALLENFQNEDGSVTLPPVLAERLGTHQLLPSM